MALSQDLSGAATGAAAGTAIAPGLGTGIGAGAGLALGLFQSSDNADQAQANIQNALAQYTNLGVPPNEAMPLILQQLQVGGKLTPAYEQALSNVGASNVQENPADRQSMLATLSTLRGMTQGGLNPEQVANAQKLQNQTNANTTANIQGLLQRQAQQGQSGSGSTLAAELNAVQNGAQNQSQGAAQIGAQGFQAQQDAIKQLMSGQSNLRQQDIGEATTNAQLQQQAALYNAQNSAARQARNVANENSANQANWGRQNQVGDTNALMANQEQIREANAAQQNWEDQLQAANAKASAYTGAAGAYGQMANNQNQNFNQTLQGLGTIGTAYANSQKPTASTNNYYGSAQQPDYSTMPVPSSNSFTMAEGGTVPENSMLHMLVKKYAQGGAVQQPDPTVAQNAPMTSVNPINLMQYGDEGPMNKNASMNTQANMMNRYAMGGNVNPAPMTQPVNLNAFGAYATGGEVQAQDMKNVAQDGRAQPQNARQFMDMYATGGAVNNHVGGGSYQPFAMGGSTNIVGGGPVQGTPMFPGNNYANDIVDAKLSPGEIVVPNTASHDPEKAKSFVEDEIYKQHAKMHGPVFQRLHERLKKVEGKKGNK